MTEQQPQTIRVQVSAWLEYQIDSSNALGDAGAFTPNELDPEGKTNLHEACHPRLTSSSISFDVSP